MSERPVRCEQCNKLVKDNAFEVIYSGVSYPFCSGKCLADYVKDNL